MSAVTDIAAVRGIEKLTPAELGKLVDVAMSVGLDPDWLAAVISFESGGTFSPSVKNKFSGATGLIQFMPATAKQYGTTTEALSQMSVIEQLDYVYRYFAGWKDRLHSLESTYLAVFYPKAISMGPDDVVAERGSAVYEQNKGFDSSDSGVIRRRDITGTISSVLRAAQGKPRVVVPPAEERRLQWLRMLAIFGGLAALGVAYAARENRRSFRAELRASGRDARALGKELGIT